MDSLHLLRWKYEQRASLTLPLPLMFHIIVVAGGTFQGAMSLINFGLAAWMDLHRRRKAMELLGQMVTYPGVPVCDVMCGESIIRC